MNSRFVVASWARSSILVLAAATLRAQEPVRIQRITSPVTLDGRVDEAAWRAIAPLPMTTFLPVPGQRPTDSSEVRLAYDDKYLYASARFFVSDPSEIQSTTLGRDQLGPDDRFRIMLDTYNDSRTGVAFLVTPTAARSDFDVTDDGDNVSSDWNTFWDAETSRDARGWYAEMRIPFSSLRFRSEAGEVTMGLIVLRVSAKKNEWSTWPALSQTKSNAIWRSSVAGKIVFEGLERHSPVYITPYELGAVGRAARLDAGGTRYTFDATHKTEIGGDLKYGLTDDLTLDLTANTDFAQVEADNQQVNLSRFSLFFPEKRQFFLERAGSFDFNTSAAMDGSRLFYSRQIGLASDGTPLRIYGGGRVVGRAGTLDVGALDLQVASQAGGGSENVGVFRARQRVINEGSYIGGIVTSREGAGEHSIVYGTDALIRPFGNDYVTAQWAQSFDDQPGSGLRASQARAEWARRAASGLIYSVNAKWSGPDFRPSLGFESRSDYSVASAELDYAWIRNGYAVQPSFFGYGYRRNADHKLDSGELYPYLNISIPSGLTGYVAWRVHDEDLLAPLEFSPDASVPAGRHQYQQGELYLQSSTGARFGYTLTVDAGHFYDGRQTFVDFTPTWSLSTHFTLGGEYQYNRLRFASRGQSLDADLARLKVTVAVDTKLSVQSFIQYNSVGKFGVGNVRLRYQFSEGNDLYIVYNDQLNTDRDRLLPASPELPLSQNRTLIAKYSYTFIR